MATHAEVEGHALRALYADLVLNGGRKLMPESPYSGEPLSPLLPPIDIPKAANLLPIYTAIVLGAMLLAGAAAIVITLIRPAPTDNAALISTVMAAFGLATMQALNFIKASQAVAIGVQNGEQVGILHTSTNSGFTEFARLIRAEARAAGVKEAEEKQFDLAAVEARITAAVEAAVRKVREDEAARVVATQDTKAVATEMATAIVAEMESVDVATIQPKAVEDIAAAVKDAPPTPGASDEHRL